MGDEQFYDNDLHPEGSQATLPITPPEKVLSPFLKTLKKRKRIKADEILEEYKEFYIRQNPQELLAKLQISFEDSLKLVTILNETAELLRVVTCSKSVNLYLTDYEQNVITLCPKVLNKNDRFHVKYQIGRCSGNFRPVSLEGIFNNIYFRTGQNSGSICRVQEGIRYSG